MSIPHVRYWVTLTRHRQYIVNFSMAKVDHFRLSSCNIQPSAASCICQDVRPEGLLVCQFSREYLIIRNESRQKMHMQKQQLHICNVNRVKVQCPT